MCMMFNCAASCVLDRSGGSGHVTILHLDMQWPADLLVLDQYFSPSSLIGVGRGIVSLASLLPHPRE